MNTKCGPLIPNFKNSPAGQASHGWEDDPTEGHQCVACALTIGLFIGSWSLTTNMVLLFSSGLQIILSKQKS